MTTNSFTPGPWSVVAPPSAQDGGLHIIGSDGFWLAETRRGGDAPRLEANARLIAATPDLLTALRDLLVAIEEDAPVLIADRVLLIPRVRSAIAKAKGGKP